MKCSELELRPEVLKALDTAGYTELTPIQQQTLEPILAGKDMIALAETGSGKTAACAIPLVQNADSQLNAVQALVLVPTRELAQQYVSEISKIAKFTKLQSFAAYGGFSMDIQKGKLAHGVHILVATPGRLIDLLYNTDLSLSQVCCFVLDEADEMLDMGFLSDVKLIFSCLTHEHQTLLFSATMAQEIKSLTSQFLNDPVVVELNKDQVAPASLLHHFCKVRSRGRMENLRECLRVHAPKQAILFCNTRRNSETLYKHMKDEFDNAEIIHGGMDQSRRTSLFRRFKKLDIQYMIATDIAARGLDFSHTTHIINYDFPLNPEIYTHRTGRTGRMGREGNAITFFTTRDIRSLARLLRVNKVEANWIGEKPDLTQKHTHRGKSGNRRKRPHSRNRRRKPRSGNNKKPS